VLVAPTAATAVFLRSLRRGEPIAVADAEAAIVALKRVVEPS
jgi:hypothetical protein